MAATRRRGGDGSCDDPRVWTCCGQCSDRAAARQRVRAGKSDLVELALIAARQDRKPTPGLGIEVLVVEMEGRREALSLPLVATPETEEELYPGDELLARHPGALHRQAVDDVLGRQLVADRQALDLIEHGKRHEVFLALLRGGLRTQLGRRALGGDGAERRDWSQPVGSGALEPGQPVAQE